MQATAPQQKPSPSSSKQLDDVIAKLDQRRETAAAQTLKQLLESVTKNQSAEEAEREHDRIELELLRRLALERNAELERAAKNAALRERLRRQTEAQRELALGEEVKEKLRLRQRVTLLIPKPIPEASPTGAPSETETVTIQSANELESAIRKLEGRMEQISKEASMSQSELQQLLSQQNQTMQMLSKLMKVIQDTQSAIVRAIR